MAWSRTLGVAPMILVDGTRCDPPAETGHRDDIVDDTVFMLAIFDKVHEITWYARRRMMFVGMDKWPRQTALMWVRWTDATIVDVYGVACTTLKRTPGRVLAPPELDDVYWFVRDALDLWQHKWPLVALPPEPRRLKDYFPFPLSVLGRFSPHFEPYEVLSWSADGEPLSRMVIPAGPLPPPWQPVEEGEVFNAEGLATILAVKDKFRDKRFAFFKEYAEQQGADSTEDTRAADRAAFFDVREEEQPLSAASVVVHVGPKL
ncbi:hypothetical protein CC85DRAFT_282698 [Cutaneotrichosporon oleaginosum]|uniref:Uncharacterized protein n=1 Tax=Cutaneotrichosporon oleaginosum TaxID=879819 RepID=A0A0J0XVW5_9TREE|nr:uncharacterized protein CC85DRAFT_282698 [Cutaneotrichosporon oleaginosum]KLT45211.1 hypothetical protein CC85DRAFT_282698 [Cutaneotrichosporon oleaginosum]TXT14953.1 hypothetical protein COLE_01146 [Cutaneotrichosporon oleaginosum]